MSFTQTELEILKKTKSKLLESIKTLLETKLNSDSYTFRVTDKCIGPLSKYVPYNYISKGQYGVVFQVCDNTGGNCENKDINTVCNENTSLCKYVIKVLHPLMFLTKEGIENEIKIATEFGHKDSRLSAVGPEVISSFSCDGQVNYGDLTWYKTQLYFIVMRKMDLTLEMYKEKYPIQYKKDEKIINDKIQKLIENIEYRGYAHNDLHENNIMVNVEDDKIIDIKIIDFGSIKGTSPGSSQPKRSTGKPRPLHELVKEIKRLRTILEEESSNPENWVQSIDENKEQSNTKKVVGSSGRVFEVTDDDEDDE